MNDVKFELPGKLEKYIAALAEHYGQTERHELQRLLVNSRHSIEEGIAYDNWNGGIDGHAVHFQVPGPLYLELFESKNALEETLKTDLNNLNTFESEFFQYVSLEVGDDVIAGDWRERSGVLQSSTPIAVTTSSDQLKKIWLPGHCRLFLSHKARYKSEVSKFKDTAKWYGLTCFVAHEDVEPTKDWQREIEKALFSMDVLVAFLTEDFHSSDWTDQELGVAIGLRVPIVSIRLGANPYGFIGKYQGLSGGAKKPDTLAKEVYDLLWRKMELEQPLTEGLITAFENAQSFEGAGMLVPYLKQIQKATPAQVERLESASHNNGQVRECFKVQEELPNVLKKLRGESSRSGKP